jgi:WD40 repeat protein
VNVLDVTRGLESVALWTGPPVRISALAFSPDAARLAVAGWDATVTVHEVATQRLFKRFDGHTALVRALAFSPDGRLLASSGDDRTIRIWRVEEGTPLHTLTGHAGEVIALAFDAEGKWLVSGATDGVIRIWSVASGACEAVHLGHEGGGSLALSVPAGSAGLRSGDGRGLRTWPAPGGRDPDVLRFHSASDAGNPYPYVYVVTFSQDGALLASGGWDNTVRIVEMDTGDLTATLDAGRSHIRDLAFSPDGKRIAGGQLRFLVWDVGTGRELARTATGVSYTACAWSPDGRRLALGDEVSRVWFLEPDRLEVLGRWEGHRLAVADLAWSPDGTKLASVGHDGVCLVRSGPEGPGQVLHRLAGHEGPVLAVAFDREGARMATGGEDRFVRIWDARTGAELLRLEGHTDKVYGVAFHPEGRLLASASNDTSIRLWDLERGREVADLQGHRSYVHGLAFSPDGATLASASGDNTVRLWSTRTMAERQARAREARARKAGR